MRNGNITYQVLPLLGMMVLILPMRNGNEGGKITAGIIKGYVLILPMRNGNKEDMKYPLLNIRIGFLSYL